MHLVDTTMFWSPAGGGVRRYLLAKRAWLQGQPGWQHSLAVPLTGALPNGSAGDAGIVALPSWPLPGSGGYRLPLRRSELAGRLAALSPDVIEAGDPYRLGWAAADAAQRCGVPALAFCHSNLEAMARLAGGRRLGAAAARVARAYAQRVYRRYDAVLAPSEAMCRHLADWGVARVERQPLGVDTRLFHPARASAGWRQAQGFGAQERLLVYAGRLAAEKHLQTLADAVARLGPRYRLLLIGDGPCPPRGERVRRLPFVVGAEALAGALASADAFVHAGDQETFGLSVLEAMACGTPVVARRREGLAELVDASVGVAVDGDTSDPACDVAAFAEAISALFEHEGQARERGQAARARALGYDWQAVFEQMTARYRRLAAGQPASGTAQRARPPGMAPYRSLP